MFLRAVCGRDGTSDFITAD